MAGPWEKFQQATPQQAPTEGPWSKFAKPAQGQPTPAAAGMQQPSSDYADLIKASASKYGVDPRLVRAVVQQESSFNPKAVSSAGAKGLMQLMPGTAAELGVTDPFDPVQNVDAGTRYLAQQLKANGGNVERALAAYNWGPGNLQKNGFDKAPKETRDYVSKITANMGSRDVPIPGAIQDEAYRGGPAQQANVASDSGMVNAAARTLGGLQRGMFTDINDAATQMLGTVIPNDWQRKLTYSGLPINEDIAQREAQYQQQRQQLGGGDFDPSRLVGNIASPVSQAASVAGMPAWVAKLGPKGQAAVMAMMRGGIAASGMPVNTTDGSSVLGTKAQQVGLGAALGPVAEGVGRGLSNVAGRAAGMVRGQMRPDAQAALDVANQAGVKLSAGDIVPENKMVTGVEGALENTRIPGLSMAGFRKEQQVGAQKVAQQLRDEEYKQLQKMSYMGIDRLRTLAQGNSTRSAEARKIMDMIDNAGTDERAIMQASGNLGWLQMKLSADRLFNDVASIAGDSHVAPTNTLQALDDATKKMASVVDVDNPSLNLLQRWKSQLESGGVNTGDDAIEAAVRRYEGTPPDAQAVPNTYARMRAFRSDIRKRLDAATSNETTDSSMLFLKDIAKAVEQDMDEFAQKTPGLAEANTRAQDFYKRHVVPYQKGKLAAALTADDPDKIYGTFVRAQAEGRGDYAAKELWKALDNKGRQAVRYGIVRQALDNAVDQGRFSPAKFKQGLESTEYATFFKGDKQRVDGVINLMGLLRKASPEHLEKYAPLLGGQLGMGSVGLGAMAVGPGNMAMGLGSAGFLKWLMTSDAGKRAMFSTNMLTKNGSNAQVGKFLDDLARQYNTAAGTAAGAEAGQTGRVLP